eukprot:5237298-Pyramimonas_sp.AAC.1
MDATQTQWKWTSSDRQYADGLTKLAARQLFADRLRAGRLQLQHDPTYAAAKKNTKEKRQAISKNRWRRRQLPRRDHHSYSRQFCATCCCKLASTCAPVFDCHAECKYYYDEIVKCSCFSGGIW